jgi:tellurite resistance protein TerC
VSSDVLPWVALALVVGGMLALDLLVVNRDPKPVPFRHAAAWSAVWISLALAFGAYVAATQGAAAGGEYLAGYLIELSLSVDNVFVFALIFAAFAVPAAFQHRLLFWGILGAIVFRAAFIAAGVAILEAAHWAIYLLGVLLVVTGIRLARSRGHAVEPDRNPVLRLFRRVVPMTDGYRGPAFVVVEAGRRLATPLLAALVAVETTDIMFALDSIPAVFAITTDPFIVFSSNLFAILGLRSLYFLLAGLLDRFIYLKQGLAALLVFAGVKILTSSIYPIPIAVSLGVIVLILAIAIAASLLATHPARGRLEGRVPWAALRVTSGVVLGIAVLGVLAGMAAVRDIDAGWLVLDVAVIAAATVTVALGYLRLETLRARPAVARAWATVGAALLLVLALFISLD